jgi:hypothetical protein
MPRRGEPARGKALVVEDAEHTTMELVACGMREQREEVVVANPVEVLDNLDDDLDRVELWTTALSCFQHPTPEYPTDNSECLKRLER